MKRAQPLFQVRYLLILTLTLLCLSLLPRAARAQSTRDYQRDFGAVTGWTASFTVTTSGSGSVTLDNFGDKVTWTVSETITGGILFKDCSLAGCTCVPSATGVGCDATTATITTTINDTNQFSGEAPTRAVSDGQSYAPQFANISYDFAGNTYLIAVDNFQPNGQITYPNGDTQKGILWCSQVLSLQGNIPFPPAGENLTYSSGPGPSCAVNGIGFQDPSTVHTQVVWSLTPDQANRYIVSAGN